MQIESYSFGVMKVDGREYRQDLIIFPDKVRSDWWRRQGHSLAVEDVRDVIEFKPELLVVGRGDSGMMAIPAATEKALQDAGIGVIAQNTAQACSIFNEQTKKGKNVVGAFHLTC